MFESVLSLRKIAVATVVAATELAVAATPLDTVDRPPVPEWQWSVGDTGELKIALPGNSYTLATKMSYPHMSADQWNVIPSKDVKVVRSRDSATVDFACKFYTLHRIIERAGQRLVVRDTFKNTTKSDLAIAFDNVLTVARIPGNGKILLAGCLTPSSIPEPSSPAQNSSIFFAYPGNSLGFVLEDDFYRLQAELKKGAGSGIVRNRSFALAPNDSYTFEYSFYPTGRGDYWDFINRLREAWGVNGKVEGNLIFCTCPHPQPASSYMPVELKKSLVDYLGAKYICGTNYTWLGIPSYNVLPQANGFLKEYGSREQQAEKLQDAIKNVAAISPELTVFAKIQTIFAAPPQLPGEPTPYADSVIIEADGKPKCKPIHGAKNAVVGYQNHHYPMVGNGYYTFLTELVDMAMESGVKVIYFDTFTYAQWTFYGRWTYDRWDGRTVDIDPKTWTISKKKADLAILVSDAQIALNDMIRKRGGTMLFNGTPATRKQMTLHATCQSFTEASPRQLPIIQHVSHPVNLGYYPGYQYRKDAWKTPKDLYENVMSNLDYGCLTYIYWLVSKLPEAPTIYKRMYPITVKRIYAGCVVGEERIVTNRSGRYSLGGTAIPRIYVYDKDGNESAPTEEQAKCENVDGRIIVTLTLPPGGAAVLEKQSAVSDCLINELKF